MTLWPKYDAEDRVALQAATTGVLLSIRTNNGNPVEANSAVFLTIEELDRIATEGRALYDEWLAKRATR